MPHMDTATRDQMASIARVREIGFAKAKVAGEFLDGVISDRGGVTDEELDKFKTIFTRDLIVKAESQYLAEVRRLAMNLMEHDRKLTAEQAEAFVESMILETYVGAI